MAPIPPNLFREDDYTAPPFALPTVINRNHRIPRGGKGYDITVLVQENTNNTDVQDYVKGIFFWAMFVLGIFFVWALMLLLFKFMGRKRVGFLSGWPPRGNHTVMSHVRIVDIDSNEVEAVEFQKEALSNEDAHNFAENDVSDEPIVEEPNYSYESVERNDAMQSKQNESSDHDKESDSSLDQNSSECLISNEDMYKSGVGSTKNGAEAIEGDTNDYGTSRSSCSSDHDKGSSLDLDTKSCPEGEKDICKSNSRGFATQGKGDCKDSDPYSHFDDDSSSIKDEEEKNKKKEVERVKKIFLRSRVVVLFSCLTVVVASILFLTEGIVSLNRSTQNVQSGIDLVGDVATGGINIIDSFVGDLTDAQSYTEDFMVSTSETVSCMEKITSSQNCSFEDDNIFSAECAISEALEWLENIQKGYLKFTDEIIEEVINARSDLVEILEIAEDLSKTTQSFTWAFYVAGAMAILLDLVVLLLAYGIVQAWRGEITKLYSCCRGAVLLPVFILNVLLLWIFASVFMIGAVVTSDFCYTSPDPKIAMILDKNAGRFTSFTYQFSIYVLKGCSDPISAIAGDLDDISQKAVLIGSTLISIHSLINWLISGDTAQLKTVCGQDISPMLTFLEFLDFKFHSLLNTTQQLRELFFCENWHPIYKNIVYDALCYDGVKGMTWVYFSLITIGFFGMVILTLRFTMFLGEDEKDSTANVVESAEDDASV